MRNRIVGIVIIGIAALIGFIIWSFNRALNNIVAATCTHGASCPMYETISFHTNISIGIMAFVVLIGLYLIFFGREEKIVTRIKTAKQQAIEPGKITKQRYEKVLSSLSNEEKKVFEKIIEAQGAIFQSELVEKIGFNKVKVTRILDSLEGKNLIERKRRGMTNIVILKH